MRQNLSTLVAGQLASFTASTWFDVKFDSASDIANWSFGATTHSVHDGMLDLRMVTTDVGGDAYSPVFTSTGKVKFTVRWFMHAANNNYFPALFLLDSTRTKYFSLVMKRSGYGPDNVCSAYDQPQLVQVPGNFCVPLVKRLPKSSSSYYDKWVTTTVTFDPSNGVVAVDLESDGEVDMLGTVDPASRFQPAQVRLTTYGWFTGHFTQFDSIRVESTN